MQKLMQKGQTIVEFVLVLPLFLLLVMGIAAFGLYFSNYVALNSIARSVAREASLLSNDATGKYWNDINARYVTDAAGHTLNTYYLPNGAYTWDPTLDAGGLTITQTSDTKSVKVELNAPIAPGKGPVPALAGLMGDDSFMNQIHVEYIMYWEANPANSTTTSSTTK